jgi:hypothetical protein
MKLTVLPIVPRSFAHSATASLFMEREEWKAGAEFVGC